MSRLAPRRRRAGRRWLHGDRDVDVAAEFAGQQQREVGPQPVVEVVPDEFVRDGEQRGVLDDAERPGQAEPGRCCGRSVASSSARARARSQTARSSVLSSTRRVHSSRSQPVLVVRLAAARRCVGTAPHASQWYGLPERRRCWVPAATVHRVLHTVWTVAECATVALGGSAFRADRRRGRRGVKATRWANLTAAHRFDNRPRRVAAEPGGAPIFCRVAVRAPAPTRRVGAVRFDLPPRRSVP